MYKLFKREGKYNILFKNDEMSFYPLIKYTGCSQVPG